MRSVSTATKLPLRARLLWPSLYTWCIPQTWPDFACVSSSRGGMSFTGTSGLAFRQPCKIPAAAAAFILGLFDPEKLSPLEGTVHRAAGSSRSVGDGPNSKLYPAKYRLGEADSLHIHLSSYLTYVSKRLSRLARTILGNNADTAADSL